MAIETVATDEDHLGNQIINFAFQTLIADPSTPATSRVYFNTATKKWRGYDGIGWQDINIPALTTEEVQDMVGALVTGNVSSGITSTYNDATNKIDLTVTDSPLLGGQNSAYHRARANHTGTDPVAATTFAATARLMGRATAGAGVGEEISLGGGLEFSGTTLRSSALTGPITTAAGGVATTIAANVVANTHLTDMAQSTIKGRAAGAGTGDPTDLTVAQVKTLLALVPGDITGFDTQVRTSRLDQMASPTATVSLNAQDLSGVKDLTAQFLTVTSSGSLAGGLQFGGVVGANHLVPKSYIDDLFNTGIQGVSWKNSVVVATTTNIALTGTQTIDGVAVTAGQRVLVKNQSTASANGIYVVAAGAWTRATDFDSSTDVAGALVPVERGTVNADTIWMMPTDTVTVGTTAMTFTQFNSAADIVAGAGLSKTGNTLFIPNGGVLAAMLEDGAVNLGGAKVTGILPITKGGTGAINAVNARANIGAVGKHTETVGNGVATQFFIDHNLNTRAIVVSAVRSTTPWDHIRVQVESQTLDTAIVNVSGYVPPASGLIITVVG